MQTIYENRHFPRHIFITVQDMFFLYLKQGISSVVADKWMCKPQLTRYSETS